MDHVTSKLIQMHSSEWIYIRYFICPSGTPPIAQHMLATQNWRNYEKQRKIETLNDLAPLRSLKNDLKKKKSCHYHINKNEPKC